MLSTPFSRSLNLYTPIINAGMAMVARAELAAAVSNGGGFGMVGCDILPPQGLQDLIRQTRRLTSKAFGVDLLVPFFTTEHLDIIISEKVAVVVFFWGIPSIPVVERLRSSGVRVWCQVGSLDEARGALRNGAEALIVQGAEAGGHNRSEASTFALLPAVARLSEDIPVIAAGGICDGATMAAALALGAQAVWCGTRFLASSEADAHPDYQARVVSAGVGDTVRTTLFGPEWPGQMSRVIENEATRTWSGREDAALLECEGQVAGTLRTPGGPVDLPRHSVYLPTRDVDADLEQLCLTAGECAGNIRMVEPAARILERMTEEALDVIERLGECAYTALCPAI